MSHGILKSGFASGGLYACVANQERAEIIVALLTARPDWQATASPCPHALCQRHGGWRVETDADWFGLKNAGQDSDSLVEALSFEEARHD